MSYCKLTIYFESPNWIGLVESEGDGGYQAAKHAFTTEPGDAEIAEFIRTKWKKLCFTSELVIEKTQGKKLNHKRMQRVIAKEVAANMRKGTEAQQALAEQREAAKQEKKQQLKVERENEQKERYAQRREKRKHKHRGH